MAAQGVADAEKTTRVVEILEVQLILAVAQAAKYRMVGRAADPDL
jgi:hypothetical protein